MSFLAALSGLKDILPEKSNIIMFQNQFQIVETDWDEREAEWRIWGKVQRNLNVYSENTSLQRAARNNLKSGKVLGSGLGILNRSISCEIIDRN